MRLLVSLTVPTGVMYSVVHISPSRRSIPYSPSPKIESADGSAQQDPLPQLPRCPVATAVAASA